MSSSKLCLQGFPLMEFTNHNQSDNYSFDSPGHIKYSEKLIEYQIIELKTNEDVLKVLIESNCWQRFVLQKFQLYLTNQKSNYWKKTCMLHNTFQTIISFLIFMLELLLLVHFVIFVLLCSIYYVLLLFYYFQLLLIVFFVI